MKDKKERGKQDPYSSPFIIGCIHGIGAETPTQMLLLLTVGRVDGKLDGIFLLITFVIGLILSNTLISFASSVSYSVVNKYEILSTVLILLSAGLSLFIGVTVLLGTKHVLPAFLFG